MLVSKCHDGLIQFPAAFFFALKTWKCLHKAKNNDSWSYLKCKTSPHLPFKLLFESNHWPDVHRNFDHLDMVWLKSQNGRNRKNTCHQMLLEVVISAKSIVIDVNDIII